MWTRTCWLSSSVLWLIGPHGQMDSLIGPRHTEGSKQEVLIKREGCSIFQLPRQPQPAFCWALSISWGVFPSVSVSFYFCLSRCLNLHFSLFYPLSPHSLLPCFYLPLSVSESFSLPLSNTVSDLTLSHIFLFFLISPHFLLAVLSFSLTPSSLFPAAAFRKLSVWNETEEIGKQY